MGGSSTVRTSSEKINTIQVQTSAYGLPIFVAYGRARMPGNLIWYDNFRAVAKTETSSSGGKGGGGVKQETTTYEYYADVAMGLCEGEIVEVTKVWVDKKSGTPASFGITVKLGAIGQAEWSEWVDTGFDPSDLDDYNRPEPGWRFRPNYDIKVKNKNYSGIAYVAAANYRLGDGAQVQNHSFEVKAKFYGTVAGKEDVNASVVINDIVTNTRYGASFPSTLLDDMTQLSNYSLAYNMLISGVLDEQQPVSEMLRDLCRVLNVGIVWTDKLKFIPYADKAATANGATYTPNLTPIYSLTDSDFVTDGEEDPITVNRRLSADAFNHVRVEFPNRANEYNSNVAEAKDQANIEIFGLRSRDVIKTRWVNDPETARTVAQHILQRDVYIRNEYEFRLPWNFILLEPMDLVTITDEALGFDELPVRIVKIAEDSSGTLTITAEDFPLGVANAELYPDEDADSYTANFNASAGDVEHYTIIEAPVDTTSTGLEVIVAASSNSALYGGCRLWVSLDGLNYKEATKINGSSRHGLLKAPMPVALLTGDDDFDGPSSGGVVTGWNIYNNSSGTEPITASIVAGRTGNAQRISWSVNNTSTKGLRKTNAPGTTWQANATYQIRIWAKASGTNIGKQIKLYWNTAPALVKEVQNPGLTADWQEYIFFIRWGAAVEATGTAYISIHNNSASQGTLDFDDFSCQPAADVELRTYSPMLSGAKDDANTDATLFYVGGEYMGYSEATLTATARYAMTGVSRAVHNNQQVSHVAGEPFVRVDGAVAKSGVLDRALVGKTIYLKLTTFNVYGNAEQSIADVDAIPYTITGQQLKLPPADVSAVTADLEKFGIRVSWVKNVEPDIAEYELRQGASWAAGVPLEKRLGTSYLWAVQSVGTYTFWVKARDVYGNESVTAASASITVTAPTVSGLSQQFDGPDFRLNWNGVEGSFPIASYEIRHGASWSAGTVVATVQASTFSAKVNWAGSRTYWVAPIDVQGNVGPASSVVVNVVAHSAVTMTSQTVDNNVLLYWTEPLTGSLPVATYEVRRGSTWAAATVIGQVLGRFSTVFEQTGGNFTYWVCPINTAGTYGTPAQLTVKVDVPPDYLLRSDQDSAFGGTKTNMILQDGVLYGPANLTETFAQHFTTRSWAGPSAQVAAGYPIYIQPTSATGAYEEVFDYGTTLPATTITVTPTFEVVAGSATITPTISVSNTSATGPWTDYAGTSQTYASNFRWVKVRLDVAASGGTGLVAISSLNIKLSVKLKNDGGSGTANAADSGGTTVTFTQSFIDVTSITVSAKATAARYAIYDFTDAPYPTSFKVLLFDTSGNRVSGEFSWSAKGV